MNTTTLNAVNVPTTTPECRETPPADPEAQAPASKQRRGLFSSADHAAEQASLSKMPPRSPEEALAMMEKVLGNSMPTVSDGTGK